jgi:hypothetical protein
MGQHQFGFQIQVVGLTTEGWSSNVESTSGSVEMTVGQTQLNPGYSTTCDAQGNCGFVVNMGTQTFNPCEVMNCSSTTSSSNGGEIARPIAAAALVIAVFGVAAWVMYRGSKHRPNPPA